MSPGPAEGAGLTPREKRVLDLMSGLANGHRYSIPDLARRFGVSEERIIEILRSTKEKLGPPPP